MRTVFLVPLTAMVAVLGGCGSGGTEEAALPVTERDLTFLAAAPQVEIASQVELQQPSHRQSLPRSVTHKAAPAPRRARDESRRLPAVVTAPSLVLPSDTAARPVSTASEPVNDRELPPGKTVTAIPVSSGPSSTVEPTDEFPTIRAGSVGVRGGGRCPPRRGPGIGIATGPRPVLY